MLIILFLVPITGQFFNTTPPRPLLGLNPLTAAPGLGVPQIRAPLPGGIQGLGVRPRLVRPGGDVGRVSFVCFNWFYQYIDLY